MLAWGLACSRPVPAPTWTDPAAASALVLVSHEPTDAEARFLSVSLADGAVAERGSLPALPYPNWDDHYEVVAAGDGDLWAAAVPSGEGTALRIHGPGKDTRTVAMPRRPSALTRVHDTLLVGAENTVAAIDLRAEVPAAETVLERQDMSGKAFDRFARDGDWLIAVDDIVVPIYADLFQVDPRGKPMHLSGLELPGVINGTYDLVQLKQDRPGTGTLFALAPYHVMSGRGHSLAALPIRGNTLRVPEQMILNSRRHTDPPVTEEHVSHDNSQDLWAGSDYSPVGGMARLGDRLLLAAGPRGVFSMPLDLDTDSVQVVDVKGSAVDVRVVGETAWVLVTSDGSGALQALSADLSAGVRHPLPRACTGILDE